MSFALIRLQDDFLFSIPAATRDQQTGVITPAVIQQPRGQAQTLNAA